MRKITLTIRLKLIPAFGGCAALTSVTGISDISGILYLEPISALPYDLSVGGIVAAVAVGLIACAYATVHLTDQTCGGLYRMPTNFDATATPFDL